MSPTGRLLIGEAMRFPDLSAEYWERVPRALIHATAMRLQEYAPAGLLRIDDAATAADHFVYLVLGAPLVP